MDARYVLRILDEQVLLVYHAYKPLLEPYGNVGCRMPHCDNIPGDAILQHLNVLSRKGQTYYYDICHGTILAYKLPLGKNGTPKAEPIAW